MDLPELRPRNAESHKGDYGRILVIGGSVGMAGSVALAGRAALRAGAGLVSVATSEACLPTVAGFEPSVMTRPLAFDDYGRIAEVNLDSISDLLQAADCVAVGPGLGRSKTLDVWIAELYHTITTPMVVDADALNALAEQETVLREAAGPRVLTPHPGEFRRLANPTAETRDELEAVAHDWAADYQCVLVLKGNRSLVTDGARQHRNETGNPGMATGGSGDVLTGVIAGLIGQGFSPWDAALLGCHAHGLAGDLAAHRLGQTSLIASDLLEFLPAAFLKMGAT